MRNFGPFETALDEIVENRAPGLAALPTHALDREQHLLAIFAYADDHQQRDGRGLTVEPYAHHRAIKDEAHERLLAQRAGVPCVPIALHLAPNPADDVL